MLERSRRTLSQHRWGGALILAALGAGCSDYPTLPDDLPGSVRSTRAELNPAVDGQWGNLIDFPQATASLPVHSAVLTTGNVLFWDRQSHYADGDRIPYVWNPTTNVFTPTPDPGGYELFCSGHSFLTDGRLLVLGGHDVDDAHGLKTSWAYDPVANTWQRLADMNRGRWYPTSVTLGNGDVFVASGLDDPNPWNDLPQVLRPGTNVWRNLTNAAGFKWVTEPYPMLVLAPDGRVFSPGPRGDVTFFVNTAGTGSLTDGPMTTGQLNRTYGNAVPYAAGKILLVGGGIPASETAEVIDLNAPSPSFRAVASMAFKRRQHNATILADGTVLVTGGSSTEHDFIGGEAPVLAVELWNPTNETWRTVAPQAVARLYHSEAYLLPDGRVVSAGGGHPNSEPVPNQFNAQIYSPPYLFNGSRPVISSAPVRAGYGQTFTIGTSNPSSISKVHLIRQSSVTHSTNMDQRLHRLTHTVVTGGVRVTIPTNANLVPPGPYMLFILNNSGVPSVAKIVLIGNQPPVAKCRDAVVEAGSSCTASVTAASINNGSFDPEGGMVTCSLAPSGPFAVGSNSVQLNCTDPQGTAGFCTATVHVGVGDNPACCPAGTNVIVGTSAGQSMTGTEGNDCILGLGGDDTIDGRGGNDFISGGTGSDTLVGGFGNDFITCGIGNDTVDSGPDNDKIACGAGTDNITAGPGDDVVDGGADFDSCFVAPGNDVVLACEQ